MNYVLIGMPGSGKTTIGKLLAEKLNYDFIDSDDFLELLFDETIPEMFAKSEYYFRKRETFAIKVLSDMEQAVISTGGGVVLREENIRFLKKNGLVIFLDRSPDTIIQDIENSTRPLLAEDKTHLFTLYEQRIELYRKYADLIIANNQPIEKVCQSIIEQISI
ncbi:MAG: shikimate kinase [Clostridiaceae bacterium]|nr:shikimate kinase [Clostridiaceae bacterium]